MTEENLKDRFNLVIYWKRKYKNQQNPEPWYLITNLQNKDEVIKLYSQRMAIEAMFRDYKKGGYNLEGTKANEQRLTSLILLVAIAYTFSSLKGLKIRKIGHQEYINRLKDKEDKYSKHSYFCAPPVARSPRLKGRSKQDWLIWIDLGFRYGYMLGMGREIADVAPPRSPRLLATPSK